MTTFTGQTTEELREEIGELLRHHCRWNALPHVVDVRIQALIEQVMRERPGQTPEVILWIRRVEAVEAEVNRLRSALEAIASGETDWGPETEHYARTILGSGRGSEDTDG